MGRILLKNMILLHEDGQETGDILIEGEKIAKTGTSLSEDGVETVIDGEGRLAACPGLFDMHVHFRDPGLTHKEDINTGAAAALAGGFTGVACMPNTNPPIDNAETIRYVIDKAKDTGVKVYPVACMTKGMVGAEPSDFMELKKAGAIAVSDDGKPVKNAEIMRQVLELSKEIGLLAISHCEDLDIINGGIIHKGEISKRLGVPGMDRASEDSITAREIALTYCGGARIHIAHVSTKGSVELIRDAKRRGVKVTCETCPHYFYYTDEKLLSRDADFRMNPPLREESDRIAVLDAVLDGTIDCIVTDHAPHAAEEKADFLKAPNGVVGLETSLAAVLSKLVHEKGMPLYRIAEIMSAAPRRLLGLSEIRLEAGFPADITVFDPLLEWTVEPQKLHSKSKNTVFKGEKLKGRTVYTISDGIIRYKLEN
jgi:dihydroorotase